MFGEVTDGGVRHQVTVRALRYRLRSGEGNVDGAGIGAGRDDVVVFEALLRAVVLDIDARIDVLKDRLRVRGNVGVPLGPVASDHVVDLARQLLLADDPCSSAAADGLNANRRYDLIITAI